MSDSPDLPLPLSAAQHGIWLGQQLDLLSPVYNAAESIEIRGPLLPELFDTALRQAVSEAQVLHARFVSEGGQPRQLLSPPAEWQLHVADLRDAADPWAAAHAWMMEDLRQPVDLSRGPLFAHALFQAAPDRFFWYQRAHHIALDGFGFSLMSRRVAEIYSALASRRPVPRGFGQLRAVIEEDAAYHAGSQLELDRAFWMERFADKPAPVSLAPPAPMSSSFLRQTGSLPAGSLERLQEAARLARVGWPDIVLAVTATFLHRLTGAQEVVLGLPVMARLGSAALRVPCMAMNIIPLRVCVRPELPLVEVARAVAAELRSARPHLRYRYEQLRRDLRLVGGQRRLFGPVVNIMPFDGAFRFAGAPAFSQNISAGPVEDLSIGLYPSLRVDFDANPECYRLEQLASLQREFFSLLDDFLREPSRPVGSGAPSVASPILDGGPLPAPPRPVLELIAQRAHEQPEAIALVQGDRQLCYRELVEAARALADRLVAAGVTPDSPVAVILPRGVDAIVACLGVLFSGAGYLPLDPLAPASRNSAILDDADPAWILSHGDSGALTLSQRKSEPVAPSPLPPEEHIAYLIYTSGSTGSPHGVLVHRAALAHFVAGATLRYGLRSEDRVLQFAPLHFDASVEEIFLTLCAGARLVLRSDEMLQSVPRLLEACLVHGITVLDLPTAFWHELVYALSSGSARLPPSIRTVIIGGEAALPERVARWRSAVGPNVLLLNTYGPTEATVVATAASLSEEPPSSEEEIPIGRPLPGVRAVLLDSHGRLAPPGAEGVLCLLGGGLARGYLRRPELDAARFAPLEALPGRPRAYRTGDKARLRPDGQLVFLGRVDDEVKISGHRIDPAEVETALLAYPHIREAAVVSQLLPGGSRRLCAHVVSESPPPSPAELRRFLLSRLPAPMVPGAFLFQERLPRSPSGKIDRAQLRAALPASSEELAPPAADATPLERLVLGVWEEVLGCSGLAAQDDFFDLGGQSLQCIQVANRLGVALGREIPVALLFRHPSAAALAQALEHGSVLPSQSPGLSPEMLADAVLPAELVPPLSHAAAPRSSPRQILLTGATGFVGAHLLLQLLRQTEARIVCTVRARDEAHALERLRAALAAQQLPVSELTQRVLALPADLSRPSLGLDAFRFSGLAAECDAVFHNAAVVSVVREYSSLRAVNVLATRELLRLAAAVRPKPFHYVSTLAVAPQAHLSPHVPEDFLPSHPGLLDGYQQSKWVAERLVQQASERGLPISVFRLGRVVSAPDSASVNTQDLFWRILLAGVPAGALPLLDVGEIWTPVDYVARALARLSLSDSSGPVFNLAPHPEVRLPELFRWVRDYGYPVQLCPVPEWLARVSASPGSAEHRATLAFFEMRSGSSSEASFGLGPIRSERLAQALADSGISCPPVDRSLLFRSLDACVHRGLLPPPPGPRSPLEAPLP